MNLEEIKQRYAESHRHYHTWKHIEYMFRIAKENGLEIKEHTMLWWAIMYHDIIYDPLESDNELKSGQLLVDSKTGGEKGFFVLPFFYITASLMGLTKDHIIPKDYPFAPGEAEVAYNLVDLDLAILGDTPEVYQEYVSNVRKEYHQATDEEWRKGRSDWIKGMLSRENIFYTDWGKKREVQARDNMITELSYHLAEGSQ